MRGSRPVARAFVLLAALAMTAAACGSDSPGDDSAGGTTAPAPGSGGSAPTTSPDFGKPLRVMGGAPKSFPFIGADAAQAMGIFEKSGLKVELSSGSKVVDGMAAGDIDIGLASPNGFIGAIKAGLEVTIVGPTMDIWDQYIIVRSNINLKSLKDWPKEQRRFGVTKFGSSGHYASVKLAQSLGWKENEYSFVTVGSIDGLLGGIRNGTHDVFLASAEYAFALEAEGSAKIFGSVGDLVGPNPLDVIAVRNDVIAKRPDAVRVFCQGFYEAQKRLRDQPRQTTVDFFVKEMGYDAKLAPRIVEAGSPGWSVDSSMPPEMLDNMAEATRFTVEKTESLTGEDVAGMYKDCSKL